MSRDQEPRQRPAVPEAQELDRRCAELSREVSSHWAALRAQGQRGGRPTTQAGTSIPSGRYPVPDVIVEITISGADVKTGDLLLVGGIPHVVKDVREVAGNRKRLQFADGNAYVLSRFANVEVTRTFAAARVRRGSVPRGGQLRQRS